jgi:DNA polymerase-3 subunit beta
MRLQIDRLIFLDYLTKCNKIVDHKSYSPALQGIYISVSNSELTLVSSNNVVSIKTKIKNNENSLKISEVGSFLIKGKYIIDILRKMDDKEIIISNEEPSILYLKGEKNEFFLNLMSQDSFPEIGFKENGNDCEINGLELKKAITQTSISVDEYNQKIVLTGLNFKIINNLFYVFGADQFRISKKIIELDKQFEEIVEANIPLRSCNEIPRIFNDNDTLKIVFTETHVLIKSDDVIFQTSMLDGNYPDINKIYPTDFNSSIFVNKNKFIRLISRADIRDEETLTTIVNLILKEEKIIIKSNTQQIGSFTEEFTEFNLRGIDDQNVYFNSKFMLDALRTFDAETVEINLIESMKPIVLTSMQDLKLSHIILPVGIK